MWWRVRGHKWCHMAHTRCMLDKQAYMHLRAAHGHARGYPHESRDARTRTQAKIQYILILHSNNDTGTRIKFKLYVHRLSWLFCHNLVRITLKTSSNSTWLCPSTSPTIFHITIPSNTKHLNRETKKKKHLHPVLLFILFHNALAQIAQKLPLSIAIKGIFRKDENWRPVTWRTKMLVLQYVCRYVKLNETSSSHVKERVYTLEALGRINVRQLAAQGQIFTERGKFLG
jgi:hypothetical protein